MHTESHFSTENPKELQEETQFPAVHHNRIICSKKTQKLKKTQTKNKTCNKHLKKKQI